MKKIVLSALLLLGCASASATGLSIVDANAITFNGYDGQPVTYTGARANGVTGEIWADTAGLLEAVYLGNESGNVNRFRLQVGNSLTESDSPGDSIFRNIGAGLINFRFIDTEPFFDQAFINGDTNKFVIMNGAIPGSVLAGNNYGPFDYILGLNDTNRGDADYDDFVVGLRFTPNAVPVPAALPLFATALGLFGFGASRRRL